jgi:hypothetical protein
MGLWVICLPPDVVKELPAMAAAHGMTCKMEKRGADTRFTLAKDGATVGLLAGVRRVSANSISEAAQEVLVLNLEPGTRSPLRNRRLLGEVERMLVPVECGPLYRPPALQRLES